MNSLDRILHQRHKEQKALKLFLLVSVLGSLAAHGIAMTVRVGNFWHPVGDRAQEDEMEVVVEDAPMEQPAAETTVPEPEEPPTAVATVQEVAIASQLAPAPIPLAPDSQAPLPTGADAPSQEAPADPKADPVSPMTNDKGETPTQSGSSGPITNPEGTGFGFGFSGLGTGFNLNGKPSGQPDGKSGGQEEGKLGGSPNGKPGEQVGGQPGGAPQGQPGESAVRTAPPTSDRPKKPVCLECPKPRFRGSEGSARVTYDIGPDGRVTNVRLRQSSGDPNVDRETIDALSKWRFDPNTIPQGGRQNVRTRVTFEEEGSNYQRQNEQRRQDIQRRPVADQDQPQQPAKNPRKPTTAINETPSQSGLTPIQKPNATAPVTPPTETAAPSPPAPVPAYIEPPPTPVEVAPPSAPVEPLPLLSPVEAPPASSSPEGASDTTP
jgi:TonB family protein